VEVTGPSRSQYLLGPESFQGTFRNEVLDRELFHGIKEAKVLAGQWRRGVVRGGRGCRKKAARGDRRLRF